VFAGAVNLVAAPIDWQLAERVASAAASQSKFRPVAERSAGAFFAHRQTVPASWHGDVPGRSLCRDDDLLFAADARLDNRDELGADLAIDAETLRHMSDAEIIFRAASRRGDAGVAKILGAFAFALWDENAKRLILARDCLGQRPLFYHVRGGVVLFATSLTALLALPGVPRDLDDVEIANFMIYNQNEPFRTLYRGVDRVPSRTVVGFDATGVHPRHYWTPDANVAADCKSEQDYVERARALFDQAVAAAARGLPRLAIAISGGLDSGAIAATAVRLNLAEAITCYTEVPPDDFDAPIPNNKYLSDKSKVEALARMYPRLDVRFLCPAGQFAAAMDWSRAFTRIGQPQNGQSDWYEHVFHVMAADGHRTVLFGMYGNHGMSWGGPYSLTELLRRGRPFEFAREFLAVAREADYGLLRTLASEVVMPAAPLRLRRLVRALQGRDPHDVRRLAALRKDFVAQAGLPSLWLAQSFDPWGGHRLRGGARRRIHRLFDRNQGTRDRWALSPEHRGLEMRDPYKDRRLAEFLVAVPEPLFRKNGVRRSFARRVFADRLPPEILNERRIGAQDVTWFRTLTARRAEIARDIDSIEASPLASRLIDVPRLKRLMAEWPKDEHAAQARAVDFKWVLTQGVYVGSFIRWVEGGNA